MTLGGKPGELRHLDAVGAVGGAGHDFVQEHHVAVPFLHPHGGVVQPLELRGQRRHLVEMRGEQRAAAIALVQVLDGRPGDGEAVERRRAAADFVEDHQRALAGLIEDRRGLDHLDHEGRMAARQIVGGADAREQPVDHADMGGARRHEAAHLGEHGDQRVLAQERRFARHVRAGDQPDASRRGVGRWRQIAIVGDERAAVGAERLLDNRVTAALDQERQTAIDDGTHIVALDRERRQRGHGIDGGQRLRRLLDRRAGRGDARRQRIENLELQRQRAIGGVGDFCFELAELRGGEAHLPGERLAMDEGSVQRRGEKFFAVLRGDVDEIAEHIVVPDF